MSLSTVYLFYFRSNPIHCHRFVLPGSGVANCICNPPLSPQPPVPTPHCGFRISVPPFKLFADCICNIPHPSFSPPPHGLSARVRRPAPQAADPHKAPQRHGEADPQRRRTPRGDYPRRARKPVPPIKNQQMAPRSAEVPWRFGKSYPPCPPLTPPPTPRGGGTEFFFEPSCFWSLCFPALLVLMCRLCPPCVPPTPHPPPAHPGYFLPFKLGLDQRERIQ